MAEQNPDALYLIALLGVEGVGPSKARALMAYCGSARAALEAPQMRLLKVPDVGEKIAAAIGRAQKSGDVLRAAEAELAWCTREGIRLWTLFDADYPEALKAEPYLPLVLYQRGPLDLNARPAVAVVGTRTPSDYGRRQAARFATALAEAGVNVVSGLAYGIDGEAHKAALHTPGGTTTAVLGHGLDRIYPAKHAQLARQIAERGGAVLSEFPRGTGPEPQNFPHRNRIIAGLCRATIVIEAAETGGALITGRLAFELNREVFALPGPVDQRTAQGCHRLIQHQVARLVTDPAEVIAELNLGPAARKPEPQQASFDFTAEEAEVVGYLDREGRLLDQLAAQTGKPVAQLMSLLLELEFKGAVRQLPGRKFVRA